MILNKKNGNGIKKRFFVPGEIAQYKLLEYRKISFLYCTKTSTLFTYEANSRYLNLSFPDIDRYW